MGTPETAKVLDVSIPAVRKYILKALDYYLAKCGFEGVKLDFWSYAFEDSHALLKSQDRTGYDWREWLLSEFRKRLPSDGYFQTGCDIVMGNPFLGKHFSNYRYGTDIGSGEWDYVLTNAQWAAFCLLTHTGHLFVPNSDSIGLFPGLTDDEALTCINFCLVSRTMVEVSGWLYRQPNHPRMAWVRKALACPNNGEDVWFAGFDPRRTDEPPDVWYFDGPHFSLRRGLDILPVKTVAVFNWSDGEKTFRLRPDALVLGKDDRHLLTDVWTGQVRPFESAVTVTLKPHASALLAVNRVVDDRPCILDADLKILSARWTGKTLVLRTAHPGQINLLLNRPVSAVKCTGQEPWRIMAGRHACRVSGRLTKPATITCLVRP